MTDFDFGSYLNHHMNDSQRWQLPFLPPLELPPPLTLHGMMVLLCAAGLIILFCKIYAQKQRVPHGLTNLLESVIVFIRDQIGIAFLGKKDGRKLTPLLCTFFFFILGLNLIGLVPGFSVATSNLSVTLALSLITFCLMTLGAIRRNGFKGFFKAFIPSDIPKPILFLIVPIEFLGVFIKTFALTIRLFANMLAGHVTISALIGLVILFGYIALPVLGLTVFIYLLKILVALIQAYIFTLLSAMFIGQIYHYEH